ncbi:hypothetical protein, partial [Siminovitchia fortis]
MKNSIFIRGLYYFQSISPLKIKFHLEKRKRLAHRRTDWSTSDEIKDKEVRECLLIGDKHKTSAEE